MTDKRKLLSLPQFKHSREPFHDPTVSHLVQHIQEIRKSVPINYELKKQLKLQLLEQMKRMQQKQAVSSSVMSRKKIWLSALSTFILLLCMTIYLLYHNGKGITVTEIEDMGSYPSPELTMNEQLALSPQGDLVLMAGKGSLKTMDRRGIWTEVIHHPSAEFAYPVWLPERVGVAVAYQTAQKAEIWIVYPHNKTSRVIYSKENVSLGPLVWSEQEEMIYVVERTNEQQDVIMRVSTDGASIEYVDEGQTANLDKFSNFDQEELMDQMRWPRKLKSKLEEAGTYWLVTNSTLEDMVVFTDEGEQVSIYWLELKSKQAQEKGSDDQT